jgi:hypothetical protein
LSYILIADFLKFVFILPRNFLLDLLNFCRTYIFCHVARTVNKILNRNGFGEGNDANQGRHVFLFLLIFWGFSLEKMILDITIYSNIFIFMTVSNNIYQKQIKHHVFNAITNPELTELVPVFTIRPAFPTSVKKVNTSFKNVWRTWGPALTALPTLLANLMIFCHLGLMNFKNSVIDWFPGLVVLHLRAIKTGFFYHFLA